MQKFLLLAAILALLFTGCEQDEDNGDENVNGGGNGNNDDVIGIWTAKYGTGNAGEVKLDIAISTWVLVFTDPNGTMVTYNGTWTRNGNTLTLSRQDSFSTATASLSGDKLILNQSWATSNSRPGTSELTKGGSSGGTGGTTLKINNQSFTEITDVIWQNVTFAVSQTDNSIKIGSSVTKNVQAGSGYIYFKRKTNPINARTRDLVVITKDENIDFTFIDNMIIVDVDNPSRSGTLAALQPMSTTLKINNQSFTEITDVIWQNVTFANNNYENSIKPSTNVTNTVQTGGGYIFFKRKSNPIVARTRDMVVVENGETIEFTFTDNTVIVEVNNPNNNGTLGALQSTVVWWDDAEGEMQPYYEARSFVGYYSGDADLPSGSYTYIFYDSPKNGNKSITIGGTTTAMLHLKLNLTRSAKFSFWYSNRNNSLITDNAVFLINGEEKRSWATDVNWSFIEFDLEPGLNDLIWEKKDGYHYYSNYSREYFYYLSLDDILIYYTE